MTVMFDVFVHERFCQSLGAQRQLVLSPDGTMFVAKKISLITRSVADTKEIEFERRIIISEIQRDFKTDLVAVMLRRDESSVIHEAVSV